MNTLVTTLRTLMLGALLMLLAVALAQGGQHGAGHGHGRGAPAEQDASTGMAAGGPMGPGMMAAHAVDEAGFLTHMIPHHQEAIDSARALLEVTERPELHALAEAIIASQTAEIEAMEGWLDAWHPDADRDVAYTPMMRDLGPDAPAEEVERAFLEDMIMHHMMAVRDARMLLTRGVAEHDEVAGLARSIVLEQMAEIDQMRAWLADWFGVTAPMGMMRGDEGAGAPGGMQHGGTMGPGMQHGGMMGPGMQHGGMMGPGMPGRMMHGGLDARIVDEVGAARLAQAFLDGRGDGIVTGVEPPAVTYEVRFDDGQGGGTLIVDARDGTVRLATER